MNAAELFDSYGRQARLQPALLLLFPLFVTAAVWLPDLYKLGTGLVGLATACGVTVFLAHLSRSLGRRAELRLNAAWGGKPTTAWMRRDDDRLDAATKDRYRAFLEKNVKGWRAPTADQEARDRAGADAQYDSAIRWLREFTRDRRRFPLVFRENVSYGFRRNLYAMKAMGLIAMSVSLAINAAAAFLQPGAAGLVSAALSAGALVAWLFVVRPDWVRDAADGYARALLAACDGETGAPPRARSRSKSSTTTDAEVA